MQSDLSGNSAHNIPDEEILSSDEEYSEYKINDQAREQDSLRSFNTLSIDSNLTVSQVIRNLNPKIKVQKEEAKEIEKGLKELKEKMLRQDPVFLLPNMPSKLNQDNLSANWKEVQGDPKKELQFINSFLVHNEKNNQRLTREKLSFRNNLMIPVSKKKQE